MSPPASTTVPEPMRSVPRMRAEGCDSGMRAWRWTVEGSTRSMRPTAAFTGPTLDARPAGRKRGRETSATHASVVSARWLYCERRSGACGGRARSSLLRRSLGYASSVVAALARLGSRLDALATSHLADTTLGGAQHATAEEE